MNILPHERPGQAPPRPQIRTIHTMTDAELEPLGPWRLSKIPGVKVHRDTIKARLTRQGMSKREACTRPTSRRASWKRKPSGEKPSMSFSSLSLVTGKPSGTIYHRIVHLGWTEQEVMDAAD